MTTKIVTNVNMIARNASWKAMNTMRLTGARERPVSGSLTRQGFVHTVCTENIHVEEVTKVDLGEKRQNHIDIFRAEVHSWGKSLEDYLWKGERREDDDRSDYDPRYP